MENETVVRVNLSFYPSDLAALHQIGKDYGLTGRSQVVRYLINYFKRTAGDNGNSDTERITFPTAEQARDFVS